MSGAGQGTVAGSAFEELVHSDTRAALPVLAWSLACIYGLLAPLHLVVVPRPAAFWMAAVAATTSLLCAAVAIVNRRRIVAIVAVHRLLATLVGLSLVNTSLHMLLDPEPRHSTNFGAVLILVGLAVQTRRWYAGLLLLTLAAWGATAVAAPPHPDWPHYAYTVGLFALLSAATFLLRRGVTHRQADLLSQRDQSAGLLRALTRSATDAILTIDVDSRIRFANPAVEDLLGWPVEELVGEELTVLVPESMRSAHLEGMKRYLASGERAIDWKGTALPALHRDGHEVPIEVSFNEILFEGSTLFTGFLRDIRARQEAEEERLEFERRTHQAQRLESVGLLAGGIAHDFNNLLTPILGYASALQDTHASREDLERAALEVERNAVRAARLARQLLAYADRDTSQLSLLDPHQQIRELETLVASLLPKRHRLRTRLETGDVGVNADPVQLQQVLMNLVLNASDASPPEEAEIELSVSIVDIGPVGTPPTDATFVPRPPDSGRHVAFTVRDRGTGIDPEVRSQLFDPFFSTKGLGRGLGLTTALRIARAHGGSLSVESPVADGAGTRIALYLPAAADAGAGEEQEEAPGEHEGRGTVLVVDDEDSVRSVCMALLGRLGYRPVPAADGEEALARLGSEGTVRFVVLDLSMPGPGTRETVRALRELQPDLPILFCSGYLAGSTSEPIDTYANSRFLHKPYTFRQLTREVEDLLAAAGAVDRSG